MNGYFEPADQKRAGAFAITLTRSFGALLGFAAIALLIPGAILASIGGSWLYLPSSFLLLLCAWMVFTLRSRGALLYLIFFLFLVVWAFAEAGLDAWALAPRLALFAGLGLVFLLPPVRRASSLGPVGARGVLVTVQAIALCCLVGLAAFHLLGYRATDPAFDRGMIVAKPRIAGASAESGDWLNYGNDRGGGRFSPLDQLTPENVGKLQVAWTFHVGPGIDGKVGSIEVTPLKVDRTLYACTSYNDVIALDAETGRERWRFRSVIDRKQFAPYVHCRGLALYRTDEPNKVCGERILTNTFAGELIALDARNGELCKDFGDGGRVSLLRGLGDLEQGYYFLTSAPTVVRNEVVVGGWVADGQKVDAPSGAIRAFDAKTGDFAWAFDVGRPDRQSEPEAGEFYTKGTPNSWAPMSGDDDLGLVYVPTGNPSPDYYGGQRRRFDEQFGSSVMAIDVETGKLRWSFQTTHHDLWDYDVPSQPSLVDLRIGKGTVKALAQPTKRGQIFLLDRETGKPVTRVEERPVPQNGVVRGERPSATQPYSVGMPMLSGPDLNERMMWGITPFDQLWCRIAFRKLRYEGTMTPPGLQGGIVYPGYAGGMNFSSAAIDRDRNILVVNTLRAANILKLIPRAEADRMGVHPMSASVHSNIGGTVAQAGTPFAAAVEMFASPLGVPCQQPPYGMLTAIDLDSQKVIWHRPFGDARESGPLGLKLGLPIPMGMPNFGGSIVTRGGLVFIAATVDSVFRAYDSTTGKELWQDELPGGGHATPMTYFSPQSSRQFVVVAASGRATFSRNSDSIVAYALPRHD